eukprot:1473225-Amphidinium_carterae.1
MNVSLGTQGYLPTELITDQRCSRKSSAIHTARIELNGGAIFHRPMQLPNTERFSVSSPRTQKQKLDK